MGWVRNLFRQTLDEGPADSQLAALEQRVGEGRPWWDQSGIPGPIANPPEQPREGFANDVLRMVDPTWEPR